MTEKKKPAGDYEVGYAKPPEHTRFKKGQSGNRKGRPKGAKNLKTDLMEELGERLRVHEGDKVRYVSKQRALIKSLVARALKGNDRAAAKIIDLYLKVIGLEDVAADADLPLSDEERAVIENLTDRLRRQLDNTEGDGEAS